MQMCVERSRAQEQDGVTVRRDFRVVRQAKRSVPGLGEIEHAGCGIGGIGNPGGQHWRDEGAGHKGATKGI
ncbi:hypothetical protein GCM10007870_16870 [Gluconobacter kondonii]|uniref:Uncharacterized protein n=1 Tax=Gluconobacter kondonii TaxID=941463 RepID=A0ABQ5WSJ9_9PROT|nr:hypothetical protein GCM10007870_16870 [Gluconobacter kondonii]